ncbi:MAG: hypothetical protein KJ914_02325 [Gammaproteobacteria bacterium]|nr:hypothetical protein [Gammaproteobacteria bacterium]MBU1725351.1 hypothetical protein [Gammaproteobacteria bacterium]MBU2006142.1 hypothetical protein [Gammaproteobacteria bacterium]
MKLFEKVDSLDKLTQAVSRNFAVSNRYLLALLLVVTVAMLGLIDNPDQEVTTYRFLERNQKTFDLVNVDTHLPSKIEITATKENEDKLDIPFIGKASKKQFLLLSMILTSLLMMLFSITHSHAIRSVKLAAKLIDNIGLDFKDKNQSDALINSSDIIDIFVSSGLTKTAPLTQLQLGKHQFLHEAHMQSISSKGKLLLLDGAVKILSIMVVYVYPLTVLFFLYGNTDKSNIIILAFLSVLAFLSSLSVILIGWHDVKYSASNLNKLRRTFKNMKTTCKIARIVEERNSIEQGILQDNILKNLAYNIKDHKVKQYVYVALLSKEDFLDMQINQEDDSDQRTIKYEKIRRKVSNDFFGKDDANFSLSDFSNHA